MFIACRVWGCGSRFMLSLLLWLCVFFHKVAYRGNIVFNDSSTALHGSSPRFFLVQSTALRDTKGFNQLAKWKTSTSGTATQQRTFPFVFCKGDTGWCEVSLLWMTTMLLCKPCSYSGTVLRFDTYGENHLCHIHADSAEKLCFYCILPGHPSSRTPWYATGEVIYIGEVPWRVDHLDLLSS